MELQKHKFDCGLEGHLHRLQVRDSDHNGRSRPGAVNDLRKCCGRRDFQQFFEKLASEVPSQATRPVHGLACSAQGSASQANVQAAGHLARVQRRLLTGLQPN